MSEAFRFPRNLNMTTAETDTQSVRERLARVIAGQRYDASNEYGVHESRDDHVNRCWDFYLDEVDAILAELAEPTEGMVIAGTNEIHILELDARDAYRAMIHYIRSGGR